mgnify:CR=1 FL=1
MSVKVNNGGLEFSLVADTGSFEKDIEKALKDADKKVEELSKELKNAGKIGSSAFRNMITESTEGLNKIMPLLKKGAQNLDTGKLEQLAQSLSESTTDLERFNTLLQFIKKNSDALDLNPEELQEVNTYVNGLIDSFSGVHEKQRSVNAELRALKEVLATSSSDSPLFSQALEDAAALTSRLKTAKAELKLATSGAPGLAATGQAVRGLLASFTALQGVIALTSGENENLEKVTRSLIASMGILQGIEEINAVLQKDSALNTFLNSQARGKAAVAAETQAIATESLIAAEQAHVVASEGATVAQEGLNTAMKANPAALLLTGLTAVIAAIQFFSNKTKDATEEIKRFNTQLQRISDDTQGVINKLRNIASLNEIIARGRGATESQITGQNIKSYERETEAYKKSIQEKAEAARQFYKTNLSLDIGDITLITEEGVENTLKALRKLEDITLQSGFDNYTTQFKEHISQGKA